jgi:MATE family multidrug resistance protein
MFGFLRMGTTGLTAQAFARRRRRAARRPAAAAAGVVIAALLVAGGPTVIRAASWVFGRRRGSAPSLRATCGSASWGAGGPANMVLLGWLLGLQNARGPMALLIVTNTINVALALLFVLGFGWAVPGVATATVCAEYGGLALGLWLARRQLRGLAGSWRWPSVLDAGAFRRLLAVNRDIMLRSLSLEAAFLSFTALSSRQGELVLAGNAVLLHFLTFAAFGLDASPMPPKPHGQAATSAAATPGFRAATRANLILALALAALALAFALGGQRGRSVADRLAEVRAAAQSYLPHVVALPLIAVFAFLFDGVFIGATRTAEMRNGMAVALAAFLGAVALLMPAFGNHGLWLAMLVFMAARGRPLPAHRAAGRVGRRTCTGRAVTSARWDPAPSEAYGPADLPCRSRSPPGRAQASKATAGTAGRLWSSLHFWARWISRIRSDAWARAHRGARVS